MRICPCGSGKEYKDCCEQVISGEVKAETAETMMRSRYTAYVNKDVDYVMKTTHPDKVGELNKAELKEWADSTVWERLDIIQTDGNELVEFSAFYRENDETQQHHELAQFKKFDGEWYFYDSQFPKSGTVVNTTPKVGRNDKCPCGSGKKYKKCCGKK